MLLVYAVIADLFFAERVEQALAQLGHKAVVADLSLGEPPPLPAETGLVIADLEGGEAALAVVRQASAAGTPTLVFGSHMDLALRAAGLAAGASKWVAKSTLTTSFAQLVSDMTQAQRRS